MAELKIKADSGGGTVSFKGPATTTSNAAVQLTLPVDDGTANQYLKTDGSGALSWATVDTSIADDSIVEAKLDISNAPADGKYLQYKDSSDKLTWATPTGASIEHKTANTSSATATLTFGTSGDLLSTNTKHFRIAVAGLSSSANMNYGRLQIGYGSTPTYHTGTDAYSPVYYMHARNTGNDGSHAVAHDDGFSFIPNVEADYHVFVGTMWGQHLTGNKWSLQSEMIVKTNNEHPKMHRVTGYTTAMSGALTSVRLITDQTFNAGEVSYVGFVS